MDIRVATLEDVPDVGRLMAAFRSYYGVEIPDDASVTRSVQRIMETENAEYLLAGEPGQPGVGVAQLRYRWSLWTDSEDCWLEDLYLVDGARGQGLGRRMVKTAIDRARSRGCGRIELDVDATNAHARALYEQMGFRDKAEGGSLFLQLRL